MFFEQRLLYCTKIYKQERKNILKMNKEVYRDAAAKKRANTSGVEISNIMKISIDVPPYNTTH